MKTDRPFHSMNAVERTRAKLRTWARECRVLAMCWPTKGSMMGLLRWVGREKAWGELLL